MSSPDQTTMAWAKTSGRKKIPAAGVTTQPERSIRKCVPNHGARRSGWQPSPSNWHMKDPDMGWGQYIADFSPNNFDLQSSFDNDNDTLIILIQHHCGFSKNTSTLLFGPFALPQGDSYLVKSTKYVHVGNIHFFAHAQLLTK